MNLILKINCKTAVSPSSGESWGGVIDTDIVYDELGIPFIPARRIKGILRESAVDVCRALQMSQVAVKHSSETDVEKLFGKPGQDSSCELIIDNAMLLNYEKIFPDLKMLKEKTTGLATTEQVLGLFTGVRAQTAVANPYYHSGQPEGIALDHSLRMQRVLNRSLVFQSRIELKKNEYLPLLALAVRVSRRLGLNRNRGFGVVEMELLDESDSNQFAAHIKKSDITGEVAHAE